MILQMGGRLRPGSSDSEALAFSSHSVHEKADDSGEFGTEGKLVGLKQSEL